MTYKQLLDNLMMLTPEQLEKDISVYMSECDEFYSGNKAELFITNEDDVLDTNHPYIKI